MPKIVGGMMALAALSASIFAGVGPVETLIRGLVAYLVGLLATQLWYVFFTIRVERSSDEKHQEGDRVPTSQGEGSEAA